MKRVLFAVIAMSLMLVMTACGGSAENNASPSAAASEAPKESEEPMTGAYTEERDLTDEDLAVFEEATAELTGVGYEPLKVSTQVVAGTNYRFYCKATTVTPEAEEKYANVYIFQPLDENEKPEVTEIEDAE